MTIASFRPSVKYVLKSGLKYKVGHIALGIIGLYNTENYVKSAEIGVVFQSGGSLHHSFKWLAAGATTIGQTPLENITPFIDGE